MAAGLIKLETVYFRNYIRNSINFTHEQVLHRDKKYPLTTY
jgi:hypothetical protein